MIVLHHVRSLPFIATTSAVMLLGCSRTTPPEAAHAHTLEHYVERTDSIRLGGDGSMDIPCTDRGYFAFMPEGKAVGTIVFLQGARVDTSSHLEEFALTAPALEKHLAVVFVCTGDPVDFLFHDAAIAGVDSLLHTALQGMGTEHQPFVLAGLSLSGTRAMRYARYCLQGRSGFGLKPAGVVLCDAPLDMVRFWREDAKTMRRKANDIAVNEATWVNLLLERNLGGTPDSALANYLAYSPYCYENSDTMSLNAFRNLPLRAYHEPDVDWWIANRAKDYYNMNSVDLAALINELRLLGNTKAELITTYRQRKGDPANTSPHSWSIVDNTELVQWVAALLPTTE